MEPTKTATRTYTVTDADTAVAVESGMMPVLGTPRLVAWCEAVTFSVLEPTLEEGTTSVGVEVRIEHLAATPVGRDVTISAHLDQVAGRRVVLHFEATQVGPDGGEQVCARGRVVRVVVDPKRFMDRLQG